MLDAMVSIILPTYNRSDQLGAAIESVLNQTYPYFELLIIDDGSTDHTEELVCGYQDDRIQYHRLQQNGGPSRARNYGIEHAGYDYIAFEDSDDIWHADKLALQMEALLDAPPEVGFVYHKIRYDMGDSYFAILPSEAVGVSKKSGDIYAQLLWDNLVDCPSILAKRECLLRTGGFDTEMKALEDYDLALKMAKNYRAIFLDKVLLESTYSTSGVSGSSINYLMASCYLLGKYKEDYLRTDTLNHRVEIILRDAEAIGMRAQFIKLMELSLK